MSLSAREYYEFGPYRLDPTECLLTREGHTVTLTPKAFETLVVLVENHGHLVEKDELLRRVWPDTFIEEATLAQNISALRKALQDDRNGNSYIETIPKHGYRFIAPVAVLDETGHAPTPVAAAVPRTSHRGRYLVAILIAGVILLGGCVYWYAGSRPVLSFSERDWILLTDFENTTGDARFDRALFTAFTVGLEQSHLANVFPRTRLGGALKRAGKSVDSPIDESLGREICQRENLRALVSASITRSGQRYELIARLIDPQTGTAARSYVVRAGKEEGILDALDTLAGDVRAGLGESLYSIRRNSRPLPQVTTPSMEALRFYADGLIAWHAGHWDQALSLYKSALKADPNFAMAHAALASALASHVKSDPAQMKEHYEKALALSGRITDRERAFIRANYATNLGHRDEAIHLYQDYVRAYPDDSAVLFNLAYALMSAQRFQEAITCYKEVLRVDPSDAKSWINIATSYSVPGNYAEALSYYRRAFELEPGWITLTNLNHEYGFALVGTGQESKAREVFQMALGKPETRDRGLRSLAILDLYLGNYKDARKLLEEAIRDEQDTDSGINRARDSVFLATVLAGLADTPGALRALGQAEVALAPWGTPWLDARIGVAYARDGAVDRASAVLERIRGKTDLKSAEQSSDLHRLEGEVALARRDPVRAVALFELAQQENPGPLALESLCLAQEKVQNVERTVNECQKLEQMRGQWLGWEAQQGWLLSHLTLGRAYLLRGDKEKAKATVEALLGLWKDADADLAALKEGRRIREAAGS